MHATIITIITTIRLASFLGLCIVGSLCGVFASTHARADAPAQVDGEGPALSASIGVGPSVGGGVVSVPERDGLHRLRTRPSAGIDLSLRVEVSARRRFLAALGVDYQTSLFVETAPAAQGSAKNGGASLRQSGLFAGIAPGYRFGTTPSGPALRVFTGWMVRGLTSITAIHVPAYTLHGPMIRPELELPLSRGSITLRAGPELAWLVAASRDLREDASLAASGLGVGGRLSADFRVVAWGGATSPLAWLHVAAMYHVLYLRAGSAWQGSFVDVAHVGSLRAELHY